ncbi:MAG: recombinase RecA [Euryarchaeota archaeon]|nr:recombinase RecA [Euryarchaeota archaeon]
MAEYAKTGVAILDKALEGGLPRGGTVLICGTPGTGIDLFAKQFAAAASEGENVVYFATSERDEDVMDTMKRLGTKVEPRIVNIGSLYYESVLAKKLEVSKYRLEGLKMRDIMRSDGAASITDERVNFLTMLTYEVSKLQPPYRLVLDSLDFFLEYYDHAGVLSALRTTRAHSQHTKSLALVTMLQGVYDSRTESGIEEVVDIVLEIERLRSGMDFSRNLIIRKVRNHPEMAGIIPVKITHKGFVPSD